MDGYLIAAISFLATTLVGVITAVIKYLVDEGKRKDQAIAERDKKLDALNAESKEMAKAALDALKQIGGVSS